MNDATINADVTMAGEGGQSLLANRYNVVKQLGQGGMGSVWLAEDTVLDNRKVAIKMLPSILFANKRAYNQLKSEALVAMKLSHPNIAAVRSFEENDGNPFIVEDYIEGWTLDNFLAEKGGTLTEEEMRKILAPVAAALDYAHEKGVVHRDVKPGNVMIAADGTPFVLDFGIAREAQETMTMVTGKLSSGTLLYMSPEQLKGAPPKAAQDVYSFAAMVYECLSGNPPFCRGQVEYQILNEPPPPLGPQFANCGPVMAGLAKDPTNRPATCAAVLAPGGVSEARGVPAPLQVATSTSSFRKPIFFVGLAVLLLTIIGGLFAWRAHERSIAAEAAAAERIREREAETAKRLAAAQAEAERLKKAQEEQAAAWEKQEAERKAREQEEAERREAERKAAEDAERQDDPSVQLAAEAEARRQENAEYNRLLVLLRVKASQAKSSYEALEPFRSEPDGFAAHLAKAEAAYKAVDWSAKPADREAAKALLKHAGESADALVVELDWLKANKAGRDAARAADTLIEKEILPKADKAGAADYATATYRTASNLRTRAKSEFADGAFTEAAATYEEAHRMFEAAADEAVRYQFKTALAAAETAKAEKAWSICLEEVEKALAWMPDNDKALVLQREAASHIEPSLKVEVILNGKPVTGAKVRFAGETKTTPLAALKLKKGETVGPFAAAFETNGKRYVSQEKAVTVDWLGPKVVQLVLQEYIEPKVKPGDTKTVTLPGGAKLKLVYCPPGEFLMGSPASEERRDDDEKQHRVTLTKGFWIGKYEVTQAQWKSVMGNNPSNFKGDDQPVEKVSWDDCQEFLKKAGLGLRLPTEAEWEYACRAGTTGPYAGTGRLDEMGWYGNNSGNATHPVGQKKPNAWGLYDMHGNVWEWCQDWYGSYDGDARDPQGPASGAYRVSRGGSWFLIPRFCRSALRRWNSPGYRSNLGFRVACSEDLLR